MIENIHLNRQIFLCKKDNLKFFFKHMLHIFQKMFEIHLCTLFLLWQNFKIKLGMKYLTHRLFLHQILFNSVMFLKTLSRQMTFFCSPIFFKYNSFLFFLHRLLQDLLSYHQVCAGLKQLFKLYGIFFHKDCSSIYL